MKFREKKLEFYLQRKEIETLQHTHWDPGFI